jgi:hypothetical protein
MTTFFVFLPMIINNYSQPVYVPPNINQNKGIALVENYLQDLDAVGATWYYTWSHYPAPSIDQRYVPMSYYGLFDDRLPVDYDGFVLFLNEPNNPAPFGAGISPQLAAERYAAFVQARPNAKLVVGNASAWSSMWYMEFIWALDANYPDTPKPQYYGFHGYVEDWITVEQLEKWWDATEGFIYYYSGIHPEIWITEFADTTGDTASFTALMDVIQNKPHITRFAYFTNRYDPEADYIPVGWHDFNLINDDGSLSPMGEVYKTR